MLNWDDLRVFLAVARAGSLTGAARTLQVDPATVGRRTAALERALGVRCFDRLPVGYALTEAGNKLLARLEPIEGELMGLARDFDAEDRGIEGNVVITATDSVSRGFVIPAIAELRHARPGIRVDVVTASQVLSLARREACIALRLSRPTTGDLVARRLATLRFGFFASPDYLAAYGRPVQLDDLADHHLLDWYGDYPTLAPAVWLRELITDRSLTPVFRAGTVGEIRCAAMHGIGIAVLPFFAVERPYLVHLLPQVAIPTAELWLVIHPVTGRIARVRVVAGFLAERARGETARFAGAGQSCDVSPSVAVEAAGVGGGGAVEGVETGADDRRPDAGHGLGEDRAGLDRPLRERQP